MISIDTCCDCGKSEIKTVNKIVLAIQQRVNNESYIDKQWSSLHGLMRCYCTKVIEFIRGI